MSHVLALDIGTSSVRAIVFDKSSNAVGTSQEEYETVFPSQGLVEQDAVAIWETSVKVIESVMASTGLEAGAIAGLGITNQRETTILWDKTTGVPYHNAIVWSDTRTAGDCPKYYGDGGDENVFKAKTGLPINAYFSATKIRWLLDNVPAARAGMESGNALFGTVDTWIIWKLTAGALHITDVTNASRTLLMNLDTMAWDDELCDAFGVAKTMLPAIRLSSEVYGLCDQPACIKGVSIAGILGDQQAALFGQTCFDAGDVKNTYGTGAFTMMNTGTSRMASTHGLLTTVAYQLEGEPVHYALEGSVAVCGSLIKWLRDSLGLVAKASETEAMALSVSDSAGVVIVPAFSGLFAPYWRQDARGVIVGLTGFVNKNHIVRAALESAALQTHALIEAMEADAGHPMTALRVDGGMVANSFLMQFQADITRRDVIRPVLTETTALGAAYAAGLAVKLWASKDELRSYWKKDRSWSPAMAVEERDRALFRWDRALKRTFDLADDGTSSSSAGEGAGAGSA